MHSQNLVQEENLCKKKVAPHLRTAGTLEIPTSPPQTDVETVNCGGVLYRHRLFPSHLDKQDNKHSISMRLYDDMSSTWEIYGLCG